MRWARLAMAPAMLAFAGWMPATAPMATAGGGISESFEGDGHSVTYSISGVEAGEGDVQYHHKGKVTADEVTLSGTATFSIPENATTNLAMSASLSVSGGDSKSDSWPPEGVSGRITNTTVTFPFSLTVKIVEPPPESTEPTFAGTTTTLEPQPYASVSFGVSSRNCNDSNVCGGPTIDGSFDVFAGSVGNGGATVGVDGVPGGDRGTSAAPSAGLGGVGDVPGPRSLTETLAGILGPGLIGLIGAAMTGLFGGGAPTIPRAPMAPAVGPSRRTPTERPPSKKRPPRPGRSGPVRPSSNALTAGGVLDLSSVRGERDALVLTLGAEGVAGGTANLDNPDWRDDWARGLAQEAADAQGPTVWLWEGTRNTAGDLVVPAVRIGAAYLTSGLSEVLWQSYGATTEYMNSPDVGTGLVNATRYVAQNNLPVNVVGEAAGWAGGDEVTWDQWLGAVSNDILAGVGLGKNGTTGLPETIRSANDFHNGRFTALEAMEHQGAATHNGVIIEVRTQSASRIPGAPGKPPEVHAKTLKPWEEGLYGEDTAGRVAAGPPREPPPGSSKAELDAYENRKSYWETEGHAEIEGLLAKDPSYGVNERGMLTKDGIEVSGDHDIKRFTYPDGTPVPDDVANAIAQQMNDTGRAGVMHGAEAQNPTKDPGHYQRLNAPTGTTIVPRYYPGSGQFNNALHRNQQ